MARRAFPIWLWAALALFLAFLLNPYAHAEMVCEWHLARPSSSPIAYQRLNHFTEMQLAGLQSFLTEVPGGIPHDVTIKVAGPFLRYVSQDLYALDLVEASDRTLLLADKLIQGRLVEEALGKEAGRFMEKTVAPTRILEMLDQRRQAHTPRNIRRLLDRIFPQGFIAKPTAEFASDGHGLMADEDEIARQLADLNSELYPKNMRPFDSPKMGGVLSGQTYTLMGKLPGTVGLRQGAELTNGLEYRVHTFYDKVIPGATISRWEGGSDPRAARQAEEFVQQFLDLLPSGMTHRQALALDIYVHPQRGLSIIEINTNRGLPGNWSGYLREPKILGAYLRFLSDNFGWRVEGPNAELFYKDLANLKSFLKLDLLYYADMTANGRLSHAEAMAGIEIYRQNYILPAENYLKTSGCRTKACQGMTRLVRQFQSRFARIEPDRAGPGWRRFADWARGPLQAL